MQIDASSIGTLLSGLYMPGSTTTTSTGTSSILFNGSDQVTLGSQDTTSSGYASLGASGVWQFNLAAVYGTQTAGIPQQVVSEEQAQAEEKALQQALDLIDQKAWDEAGTILDGILEENKTNAAAVQAKGLIAQGQQHYDEAEQLFLRAHSLDSSAGYDNDAANARILQEDDQTVYARATAMTKTADRRDEGVRLLIALTDRNSDYAAARISLAGALIQSGDPSNGLMQYSQALRTANVTELKQIHSELETIAAAAPKVLFARQLLGRTQMQMGDYDTALQTLSAVGADADVATPYERDLAKAYAGVGAERLDSGDVTGAMSMLLKARELSPTDGEIKVAVAKGYVARAEKNGALGELDGALADYTKAAELLVGRNEKELRARAAQGAYSLGMRVQRKRIATGDEVSGEVAAFQAAYDLDKTNLTYRNRLAEGRNALGDQYMAEDDWKAAAAAYGRAYSLVKNNTTYKNNTINAWVTYADDRLYNMNYDDAVEAYRSAFKIDTQNAAVRQKLANAYNARGLNYKDEEEFQKAAQDFHSALLLFPDNATYQANYNSLSAWETTDD